MWGQQPRSVEIAVTQDRGDARVGKRRLRAGKAVDRAGVDDADGPVGSRKLADETSGPPAITAVVPSHELEGRIVFIAGPVELLNSDVGSSCSSM